MVDEKYEGRYTRQYYRVEYPEMERPRMKAFGKSFFVQNISEKSGKFRAEDGSVLEPGTGITGVITFHDGEEVEFSGEVLRVLEGDAVVCFRNNIHFKRIFKEQWYLMQRYRHLM